MNSVIFTNLRCPQYANVLIDNGVPLDVTFTHTDTSLDFSTGYTGTLNVGDPDEPETQIFTTSDPTSVVGIAAGLVQLVLTLAEVQALPTRPCPFLLFLTKDSDDSIVGIVTGRLVVTASPGAVV